MSEITVRWDQRVAGRHPGAIETAEKTPFLLGCLAQGRCTLLSEEPSPVELALPVLAEIAHPEIQVAIAEAAVARKVRRAKIQPRVITPALLTFEAAVESALAGVDPETDDGADRLA